MNIKAAVDQRHQEILTDDALALVNRFLPAPGGIGSDSRPGHESESPVTRSLLTSLTQKAAAELNQTG